MPKTAMFRHRGKLAANAHWHSSPTSPFPIKVPNKGRKMEDRSILNRNNMIARPLETAQIQIWIPYGKHLFFLQVDIQERNIDSPTTSLGHLYHHSSKGTPMEFPQPLHVLTKDSRQGAQLWWTDGLIQYKVGSCVHVRSIIDSRLSILRCAVAG